LGYGANARVNQPSYGAKLLVAGNDRTLNNFLQEYVNTVLKDLGRVMNINLRKTLSVYVLPSGNNTLCQYIAERDPLYRQNVFQFFSHERSSLPRASGKQQSLRTKYSRLQRSKADNRRSTIDLL